MTLRKEPQSIREAIENAEILSAGRSLGIDAEGSRTPLRDKSEIVREINQEFSLVLWGSKTVVLRERPDAPIEDRVKVLSMDGFRTYFENKCGMIHGHPKPFWARYSSLWLQSPERRSYEGVEFFPDPQNASGFPKYFNLWRGFGVTPDRTTPAAQRWRKYSIFADHLENNICSGNREHFLWLWAWFASLVQRPRERIATAVVLRGKMGTGKTVAGEVIGSLFPSHYFLVDDARYLTGQFNAHMASCLLLQVDEGFWAGDKGAEGRLKGLISSKMQMIEAKGIDPVRLENRVRVMFSSNESWVVPAGMDERRFAVFDVASHVKENHTYFEELFAELNNGGREALLADLLEYDLRAPSAPDPRVIPKTGALLEQKLRSLDPVAQWWLGRLRDGTPTHRRLSWPDEIPAADCFNDYLRTSDKVGVKRKSDETAFAIKFRDLVPELTARRRTADMEEHDDNGRPTTVRKQVRCYRLPSLQRCRELFEEAMRQPLDWGDHDEPADEGETDEVIDYI